MLIYKCRSRTISLCKLTNIKTVTLFTEIVFIVPCSQTNQPTNTEVPTQIHTKYYNDTLRYIIKPKGPGRSDSNGRPQQQLSDLPHPIAYSKYFCRLVPYIDQKTI